jgi:hypothetical protein
VKKGPPISRIWQQTRNQKEINKVRNDMAKGNYPLSMSDCEVVGIQGNCGPECPVKLRGDCKDWETEPLTPPGESL